MKNTFLILCFQSIIFQLSGQGFSTNSVNWPTATGGQYGSTGIFLGFNHIAGGAYSNNNAQSWSLVDMNGDSKPDLVVTSQYYTTLSYSQQFNASSNPYWKVYLNSGTDFSTTAINWTTPMGGNYTSSGTPLGFIQVAGTGYSYNNCQSWALVDMNGDLKPDLVVTSQYSTSLSYFQQFGVPSTPYWKVYLNTGNGFASTPVNWVTPTGGQFNSGGTALGYSLTSANAYSYNNSVSYAITDMDADGKVDLVVTAQYYSTLSNTQQFGASSNPYWKVYYNDGSGFAITPVNWSTPMGGQYNSSGQLLGFNLTGNSAYNNNNSQSWNLVDMDGDHKQDLVVTSQYYSSLSYSQQFGASSSPYWKVYYNNGSGFASSAYNWPTPMGGQYSNSGTGLGFILISGVGYSNNNSQSWSIADLDGDGKTDLVVTSQYYSSLSYSQQFGASSSPYWKVYFNNGTGYATLPVNWTTPMGGQVGSSGIQLGFSLVGGTAYSNNNAESWSIVDLDGNGKTDLVVPSRYYSSLSYSQQYGASSAPYWKVFMNTSTTGIVNDEENVHHILLYPNPAKEMIFVDSFNITGKFSYKILNNTGQVIQTGMLSDSENEINITHLASGIYFLEIGDKVSEKMKFVKVPVE